MTAPEERGASLQAARQLIHARRPELAERELRRWLAEHPQSVVGHALLGWCLALQNRAKEAIASVGEAVRLGPDWPYTHASRAEVHLQLGRSRDAERSARAALALDSGDPAYHAVLAAALLNQRGRSRPREALRATEDGLALDPEHVPCARLRAQALSRLRRHAEAREAAAFALGLGPEVSETHAAAGWIEMAAGDRARALELQHQALRLDPANADARRGLRMAAYTTRLLAAMLVQAERWKWPLLGVAAVFAAVLAAVLPRADGSGIAFVAGCTVYVVGGWGGGMLWTRVRHRRVVEELRLAGPDDLEAKEARQMIVGLIASLLLAAVGALL